MKSYWKRVTLAAIFAAAASAASAQTAEPVENPSEESAEEGGGSGFTIGIEAGFGDVIDEAAFSITPNVVYENSFLNESLDVFAEIDYTAAFGDPTEQGLYIEEEIGYNFSLIKNGTLSIILNNVNEIQLSPKLEDGQTHLGTFEPSLKWTQGLGFGDLWLKVAFPTGYMTGVKDEDASVDLAPTLGWDSAFGLAVELGPDFSIKPEGDLAGYHATLSYDHQGFVYGQVDLEVVGKEFENVLVTPEIGVNINALNIYIKADIEMLAENEEAGLESKTAFRPAAGVKYSF
ncbi:MAG: hypothetical protein LBC53_04005 [Spirochaetaceae bacterium]|jgi:hypothetical protein|nr:hypothetical protein [Spirochaetaceae bacterium]